MGLSSRDVKDDSVKAALKKALTDFSPGKLHHAEVVNIIRSTFDSGAITKKEQADLHTIYKRGRFVDPHRSKRLLFSLLYETGLLSGSKPRTFLLPRKASDRVCDLLIKNGIGAFKNALRDEFGLGLMMRLHKPSLINQGPSSLCGPAILLYNIARDKPLEYVEFAIGLYEDGKGKIGKMTIEPSDDCKNYLPPRGKMHVVDWVTTASIRDSENAFLDYQSVDDTFSGITMPGALEEWFKNAGYIDVVNDTNLVSDKGGGTIDKVNKLRQKYYRICLFIHTNMLYAEDQADGSATANHWVVLQSDIKRTGKNVSMEVYSWGDGKRTIPQNSSKPLSEENFLNNFYGFVGGKPF